MCLGARPQAPQIIYQGPSQAELDANRQGLEIARQQQEQSNTRFQSQLDSQIASANAEAARRKAELEAQTTAAAADAAARQTGAYAASASQSAPAETALTTEPIMPKKKPSSGLKIAPGGTAASAGAGLNIGV
jgi:hypothetical protein